MFKTLITITLSFILLISCGENDNPDHKEIYKKYRQTLSEDTLSFSGFYFVGKAAGKPSVYHFEKETKKRRVFWWHPYDKVISLRYSTDKKKLFFLTSRRFGVRGALPFFERLKLFRIDPLTEKEEFITEIGNGIQVTSFWETKDLYKVVYLASDPVIASYVNRNTLTYNYFGKLLDEQVETFDLTSKGFPTLEKRSTETTSPSGFFHVINFQDSVFIEKLKGDEKIPVITNKNINTVKWEEKKERMFITAYSDSLDLKSDEEFSTLSIVNLTLFQKEKSWGGTGLKRFVVIDDFLIFDSGFERDSYIIVYDFINKERFDSIKVRGGCGLTDIPSPEGFE